MVSCFPTIDLLNSAQFCSICSMQATNMDTPRITPMDVDPIETPHGDEKKIADVIFVSGQQTAMMRNKVEVLIEKHLVKLLLCSSPNFNLPKNEENKLNFPGVTTTHFNVPCYGESIPLAVCELGKYLASKSVLPKRLGIKMEYGVDPVVQNSINEKLPGFLITLRSLEHGDAERKRIIDELFVNIKSYVDWFVTLKDGDFKTFDEFAEARAVFFESGANIRDNLHFDHVLTLFCKDISPEFIKEILETKILYPDENNNLKTKPLRDYFIGWLVKAIGFKVRGCLTDIVNLIALVMKSLPKDPKESDIVAMIEEFTRLLKQEDCLKLKALAADFPTIFVGDCELDDMFSTILGLFINRIRGVRSTLVFQLPTIFEKKELVNHIKYTFLEAEFLMNTPDFFFDPNAVNAKPICAAFGWPMPKVSN